MKPLLIVAVSLLTPWVTAGLFAKEEPTSLKDLILQKFDFNHDGELIGIEKDGAVIFLQKADKDHNSEMSTQEQTAAIAALKKMPNPKNPAEMQAAERSKIANSIKTSPKVDSKYYKNKTIIAVSGAHTVVPKDSILYVPPLLAKMIVTQPKGELMSWPDFRDKYKGYVKTLEVTPEMAKGEQRLKSSDKSSFYDDRKIVVALINGLPISVLKPDRN